MPPVHEALEQAHRELFGRLVGWLLRRTGDLQLAEDAVANAFASAVTTWPANGVPDSAEAWLRVAARNYALTALRQNARSVTVAPEQFEERAVDAFPDADGDVDDRLSLLFVCAHPAIDARMHAPLMLQAVLGIDAARIASVFLVPPSTMGQRLSRAKGKIRDAGVRYRMAEPEEFPARLGSVLQAVYGAYGLADPIADDGDDRDAALRAEALRLSDIITELLPAEAEAWGLRALLLHTESRRPARIIEGEFIPLDRQDTRLWSQPTRRLADDCLRRASAIGQLGRFQLEAAISAIHSSRADGRPIDRDSIGALYDGLLRIAPSVGATVGAAANLIATGAIADAAHLLDTIPTDLIRNYQPYWVCRARLELARADDQAAIHAAERAIGLTSNPALRRHLVNTLRER